MYVLKPIRCETPSIKRGAPTSLIEIKKDSITIDDSLFQRSQSNLSDLTPTPAKF